MDTIEIERIQAIATKLKSEYPDSEYESTANEEFYGAVIQLGEFAKLQERKLARSRNPMNESIQEELAEMTSLAREQSELIKSIQGEVGELLESNAALHRRLTAASMSLELTIAILAEEKGVSQMDIVRMVEKRLKGALLSRG